MAYVIVNNKIDCYAYPSEVREYARSLINYSKPVRGDKQAVRIINEHPSHEFYCDDLKDAFKHLYKNVKGCVLNFDRNELKRLTETIDNDTRVSFMTLVFGYPYLGILSIKEYQFLNKLMQDINKQLEK